MEFNEGKAVVDIDAGNQLNNGILAYSKKVGGNKGSGTKILALTKKLRNKETEITGNDTEASTNKLSTSTYNSQQTTQPTVNSVVQKNKFEPKPIIKPVVSQNKFLPKPVVEDSCDLEEQYRYSSVKDAKMHSSAKSHFKIAPKASAYEPPEPTPQKALNIHQSFEKNKPKEPPKLFKNKLISHYNTLRANK